MTATLTIQPSLIMLRLSLAFLTCILVGCKNETRLAEREPWSDTPAFWVWNQTTPPPASTTNQLYLQVAEFTPDSHRVLQSTIPPGAIPVVRLPPGRATLDNPGLRARLFSFLNRSSPKQLQLDYDCASMNLARYADFLTELRSELKPDHLSITALASWIEAPGFSKLTRAVDEIAPMFYDLEVDQASEITALNPLPMIDEATLVWIKKWQKCPITWRAGLPNFQRLTLFEPSGKLVGHLQRWTPADLRDFPGLESRIQKNTHSFSFHLEANQPYQGIELKAGQLLVWRQPDEDFTRRAIAEAKKSGASGVIWFAHPDSAPVTWHSIPHLTAMQQGQDPRPNLHHQVHLDGSITVTNHGPGDLPFWLWQEPWELVLKADKEGGFASAGPGDFEKMAAHGSSLVRPQLVRQIGLSFSHLHSGQSLTSDRGLVHSPEENAPHISIHPQPPSP